MDNDSIGAYVRERLTKALGLTLEGKLPSMEVRIESMAAQANMGCGQSYDLFLERFSGMVGCVWPPGSDGRDRAVAIAITIGGYATPSELAQAQREMADMGYCCHGLDPHCCPCGCGDHD